MNDVNLTLRQRIDQATNRQSRCAERIDKLMNWLFEHTDSASREYEQKLVEYNVEIRRHDAIEQELAYLTRNLSGNK